MKWTLEHAYDEFPRVEEEFGDELDVSLEPHGPSQLFDLVAGLGLGPGAVAVDVGCGEGGSALELQERFGFAVTGIDPVERHIQVCRAKAAGALSFLVGSAEALPVEAGSVDLVWCRDVLVHIPDLGAVYREFARVLRPGGHALVYQMYGTELLEPREAAWLFETMGVVPGSADPAATEAAIAAAGLKISRVIEIGTEWGEHAQERGGKPGRKLLHAARLRRERERFVGKYGQATYDMMLGDALWHVYAMIGKLHRRAYVVTKP